MVEHPRWRKLDSIDKRTFRKILQTGEFGTIVGAAWVKSPKWFFRFCEIGFAEWQISRHYDEITEQLKAEALVRGEEIRYVTDRR